MALEREMATYRQKLPEFLDQGLEGKYVLIQGDQVILTCETLEEAVQVGYERSLTEPFLAKQIDAEEKVRFYSRNIRQCQP
jgi:hypothetical protein